MNAQIGRDLSIGSSTCPHCAANLTMSRDKQRRRFYVRCPSCRCWWFPMGELVKWGNHCPLLVKAHFAGLQHAASPPTRTKEPATRSPGGRGARHRAGLEGSGRPD